LFIISLGNTLSNDVTRLLKGTASKFDRVFSRYFLINYRYYHQHKYCAVARESTLQRKDGIINISVVGHNLSVTGTGCVPRAFNCGYREEKWRHGVAPASMLKTMRCRDEWRHELKLIWIFDRMKPKGVAPAANLRREKRRRWRFMWWTRARSRQRVKESRSKYLHLYE